MNKLTATQFEDKLNAIIFDQKAYAHHIVWDGCGQFGGFREALNTEARSQPVFTVQQVKTIVKEFIKDIQ